MVGLRHDMVPFFGKQLDGRLGRRTGARGWTFSSTSIAFARDPMVRSSRPRLHSYGVPGKTLRDEPAKTLVFLRGPRSVWSSHSRPPTARYGRHAVRGDRTGEPAAASAKRVRFGPVPL